MSPCVCKTIATTSQRSQPWQMLEGGETRPHPDGSSPSLPQDLCERLTGNPNAELRVLLLQFLRTGTDTVFT